MNGPIIHAFLSGAISLGFFAIGLFFLNFWRQSRDRLFALFATSFLLLAFERVVLVLVNQEFEFRPYIFLIRLLAFLLIITAIADRNRRGDS